MNWRHELITDKPLLTELLSFYDKYGKTGLKKAMQFYADHQKEYICRTKTSTSKLKIDEIYYLKIQGHTISVHTDDNIYQKYGTLNKELEFLSSCGFVKCNQSCVVSLSKIRTIQGNDIILTNQVRLHISRNYISGLLIAFHNK